MGELLKMEFEKACRNVWFALALVIGCVLAVYNALQYIPTDTFTPSPDKFYYPTSQGCVQAWMSINTSSVALLFYQILPLLAVAPYAWSFASELKDGYICQVYTRTARLRYVFAKYVATMCSAGLVAVVPQLLNFIVLACLFPLYTPVIADSMYLGIFGQSIGSWLFYNVPLGYVALYCGIDFAMCGLWAGFTLSLSFLVRNRVALLVAPYAGLMVVQFVNERLFLALGGIRGIPLSFFENLYGGAHMYAQNGWIILGECVVLAVASIAIIATCWRRDPL